MSIRNKTKRRLLLLLSGILLISGVTGGIIAFQLARREQQAAESRTLAIAAAREHRYAEAVELFRPAMRYYHEDPEALYWLACSRREVPLPNHRHIEEAVAYLDRALKFRPGYKEARNDLLQIYVGLRRDTEALDLAERVLATDPEDFEALRAKVIALGRLRRLDEAMETARRAATDHPDEYRFPMLILDIMDQQKADPGQMIEYAAQVLDQHPDDPRFELVMAFAYGLTRRGDEALALAQELVSTPAPGGEFLTTLVSLLDGLGRYDLSIEALRTNARRLAGSKPMQMLLRRLWEAGRHETILEELSDLDPSSPTALTDALAMKALALGRADRAAESQPLIAALHQREKDPQAQAWATVLEYFLEEPGRPATQVLQMLNAAATRDPTNPYILYARGDAHAKVGESETALDQWERAAELSASWHMPHLRMAQVYSVIGRHEQAMASAAEARRRAPRSAHALLTQIQVVYEAFDAGLGSDRDRLRLLEDVAHLHEQAPHEPQTLPIYIDLLSRHDQRDKAAAVLASALAEDRELPQETLLRLAVVCREHNLQATASIIERSRELYGLTPELAMLRAEILLHESGPQETRRYVQSLLAQIGPEREEVGWRLLFARVLDMTGDPVAHDLWVALIKDFPDHLGIQRAALQARCLQDDRAALDRAVQHLRDITGEAGLGWRIAEAKLLTRPQASEEDLVRAVNILKQVVRGSPRLIQPRLMLAETQQRLGITGEAIDQLNHVATLQPSNAAVLLGIAELRTAQGDFHGARQQLRRLPYDSLIEAQVQQAARLHLNLGDGEQAAAILKPAYEADPSTTTALLLAQAYVQTGQADRARQVFQPLMSRPSAAAVIAYAEFLDACGEHEQAILQVQRLAEIDLRDYERHMLLAAFHHRRLGRSEADTVLEHLRAASGLDPGNPAPYRAMMALHAALGEPEALLSASRQALDAGVEDPVFEVVQRHAELLSFAIAQRMLRGVVELVVGTTEYRPIALEALQVVRSGHDTTDRRSTALQLRKLADRAPRSMILHLLAIDWCIATRQHELAAEWVANASHAFPREPAPLERAIHVWTALGRWEQAVAAADEWKRRAPTQARAADLAAAQALINAGQARRALVRLDPYRSDALADPTSHSAAFSLYITALVGEGRADEAATAVEPLLRQASHWRIFWINLISSGLGDPVLATRWIESAASLMPADSTEERIVLAQAWIRLADRSDRPQYRQRAADILQPLAAEPDADSSTLFAYGMLLHQQASTLQGAEGQEDAHRQILDESEQVYRRCLKKAPDHWTAMNNLAMLLSDQGRSLDEAARLASRAAAIQPNVASLHDTLASVELRRERFGPAVASLEKAVQLDPANPEWQVNLAYALLRAGDEDRVGEVLQQLDAKIDDPRRLSPATRQRLEEVRRALTEGHAAR